MKVKLGVKRGEGMYQRGTGQTMKEGESRWLKDGGEGCERRCK